MARLAGEDAVGVEEAGCVSTSSTWRPAVRSRPRSLVFASRDRVACPGGQAGSTIRLSFDLSASSADVVPVSAVRARNTPGAHASTSVRLSSRARPS